MIRVTLKLGILVIGCWMVISFAGCYNDNEQLLYPGSGTVSCTGVNAKFAADVKLIIQNKCATAGCHDAATAAGGAVLVTYAQIAGFAARINQRCVIEKNMPPGSPLTKVEIAILKCWIDSGAINN